MADSEDAPLDDVDVEIILHSSGSLLPENTSIRLPAWENLPVKFREFLTNNQIPPDAFNISKLYRYIRLNPRASTKPTEADILKELAEEQEKNRVKQGSAAVGQGLGLAAEPILLERVRWLEAVVGPAAEFYRLDIDSPIANLPCYRQAQVYGMDISSAATIAALDLSPSHNVLDLCAAPLTKTAMICDTMYTQAEAMLIYERKEIKSAYSAAEWRAKVVEAVAGSVTAVDIADARIAAGAKVCRKYSLPNTRVFLRDATEFDILGPDVNATTPNVFMKLVPTPALVALGPPPTGEMKNERPPKTSSKKLRKASKKHPTPPEFKGIVSCTNYKMRTSSQKLYDRVLLDAQCTLDASVRHLLKYNKVGWLDYDAPSDAATVHLQKRLIHNAFRLLVPGGILVYSTCSFCLSQNEYVIKWLLDSEPTAEVSPIQFSPSKLFPQEDTEEIDIPLFTPSNVMPMCIRFYPKNSQTSGMFIARVLKRPSAPGD